MHSKGYEFNTLTKEFSDLSPYVSINQYGDLSIDFSDPIAVRKLNEALLFVDYGVKDWNFPDANLCPSIPGRVDYIHHLADLLSNEVIPMGTKVKGLDIGTGASCIYPLLGNSVYGWKFVGTDIMSDSINSARKILNSNSKYKKNIKIRFQESDADFFKGIIKPEESFDFTMCNPPFFSSKEQAKAARERKVRNLNLNKEKKNHSKKIKNKSNFKGHDSELWTKGGELEFITRMIHESILFEDQCTWFTSLVSNKGNISKLKKLIESYEKFEIKVIAMEQGNKLAHILAWSKK